MVLDLSDEFSINCISIVSVAHKVHMNTVMFSVNMSMFVVRTIGVAMS
jgi:hypothetical protein